MAYVIPPVLNVTSTLPNVSSFQVSVGYRGGSMLMSDGSTHFDIVNTNAKRTWILEWRGLTTAQKDTIVTAYALLKTGSVEFIPPDYISGTKPFVIRSPEQDALVLKPVYSAGGLLWETTMELWEV
jgi:hypothetical protein